MLGGYSQGAAVMDMLAGVPPLGNKIGDIGSAPPLPGELLPNIAAVAVFGNPSTKFGNPLSASVFAGKGIDACSDGDPICSAAATRSPTTITSAGLVTTGRQVRRGTGLAASALHFGCELRSFRRWLIAAAPPHSPPPPPFSHRRCRPCRWRPRDRNGPGLPRHRGGVRPRHQRRRRAWGIGDAFVESLRGKVGGRSVGAYAVNYPASYDFLAAAGGANDASGHIQ